MNRMRKGFVALAIAGLLLGVGGQAQAVIGIPDDVPAATLLFPFFKVNPSPTASDRQDSLIVITNTAAVGTGTAGTTFAHVTLYTRRSVKVYDFTVNLTNRDVFSCSLLDLLVNPNNLVKPCDVFQAPSQVVTQLTAVIGGTTLLIGYVVVDTVTVSTTFFPGQASYAPLLRAANVLVGHLYLVNLIQGSATGFNAVSIERINPTDGHNAVPQLGNYRSFYFNRCLEEGGTAGNAGTCISYDTLERIDGPNGDLRQTGTASHRDVDGDLNADNASNNNVLGGDSPLKLIVRYFTAKALNASTEVWLWKDRNTDGVSLNLSVLDEDENRFSIPFAVPDEVNFLNVASIVSPSVNGGWIRLEFACTQFGCAAWPGTALSGTSVVPAPIQAVAYSVQNANSVGTGISGPTLRWDAAFPAHRQYTNYIGGTATE